MLKQRLLPWTLIILTVLAAAWVPGAPGRASQLPYPDSSQNTSWVWNSPGQVYAPILLYHHISDQKKSSRYFVSPADFKAQMESLKRWGYTPIPLSMLVTALVEGAYLPEKPVVLTFDDGYRDIYQHAFPILQEYGYVGTIFVITDQIGVGGYLTYDQITELVKTGWELGSHTKTHANLRNSGVLLGEEIPNSRLELEAIFGVPVTTFSYPYGLTSAYLRKLVEESGYAAAVGLGGLLNHTDKTRFFLSRVEIQNGADLDKFGKLLSLATDEIIVPIRLELQKSQPR